MNEIKSTILKVLSEINPYEDFYEDTELIESGVLDSLTILFLVSRLEEEAGIVIDEKKVIPDNFKNIQTIIKMIEDMK